MDHYYGRLIGFVLVLIALKNTSIELFVSLAYAVTVSHYVLALIYSRRRFQQVVSSKQSIFLFLIICAASLYFGFIFQHFGLVPAFGLHWLLGEVYLAAKNGKLWEIKNYSLSRLLFYIPMYLLIVRNDRRAPWLQMSEIQFALWGLFVIAAVIYFSKLLSEFDWQELLQEQPVKIDVFWILIVGYTLIFPPWGTTWIVFHHVTAWIFIPLARQNMKYNSPNGIKYIALTTVSTVAFFTFTFAAGMPWSISEPVLTPLIISLSYFHFATSFILSEDNPRWMLALWDKIGRFKFSAMRSS